jgi:hypothetical protein
MLMSFLFVLLFIMAAFFIEESFVVTVLNCYSEGVLEISKVSSFGKTVLVYY